MTSLRDRIEATRAEVLALQTGADSASSRHARRTLELGMVLQSVANLSARCFNSPHGHTIKHSAKDSDVLGKPIPDLSSKLGLPPLPSDDDTAPEESESVAVSPRKATAMQSALDSSKMQLLGSGMEDQAWLQPYIAAAQPTSSDAVASGRAAGDTRGGSASRALLGNAATILSVASPRKKHSQSIDEEGTGSRGASTSAPGGSRASDDVTGMDPVMIRDKVMVTLGQLYTVGSFIEDYQQILKGHH